MKAVYCPYCSGRTKRNGRASYGSQRWRRTACGASMTVRYGDKAGRAPRVAPLQGLPGGDAGRRAVLQAQDGRVLGGLAHARPRRRGTPRALRRRGLPQAQLGRVLRKRGRTGCYRRQLRRRPGVIGCPEGHTESAKSWREFFFRFRGPASPACGSSPAPCAGMLGALGEVFPGARHRHCAVIPTATCWEGFP